VSFFHSTRCQNAGGLAITGISVIVSRRVGKDKLRHDEIVLFIGFIVTDVVLVVSTS